MIMRRELRKIPRRDDPPGTSYGVLKEEQELAFCAKVFFVFLLEVGGQREERKRKGGFLSWTCDGQKQ